MTQKFAADGRVVPVTKILAGPCTITQIKKQDRDRYQAVQVGFGGRRVLNKPLAGHLRGLKNFRFLKEFRVSDLEGLERGKNVTVGTFEPGDRVQVTGTSKGRGFQGVVKRHHFHGHPVSHGHKDQLRKSGSIGSGGVQKVFKNLRMAGQMGNEQVTVKNLEIVAIDEENNLLFIKGAVPGARHGLVMISGEGEIKLSDDQPATDAVESEALASAQANQVEAEQQITQEPVAEEVNQTATEVENSNDTTTK